MPGFTPSSYDFTNGALFRMTFSNRVPNVVYESYSITLPGITLGEVIQPTPLLDLRLPGDKISFEPLIFNFLVQENLANYIEIYNWMIGLGKPNSTDQRKSFVNSSMNRNIYDDGQLTILTNKNNPIARIKFVNCWPTNLSPLTYDASITDATPLTADCTFNYHYYEFETL